MRLRGWPSALVAGITFGLRPLAAADEPPGAAAAPRPRVALAPNPRAAPVPSPSTAGRTQGHAVDDPYQTLAEADRALRVADGLIARALARPDSVLSGSFPVGLSRALVTVELSMGLSPESPTLGVLAASRSDGGGPPGGGWPGPPGGTPFAPAPAADASPPWLPGGPIPGGPPGLPGPPQGSPGSADPFLASGLGSPTSPARRRVAAEVCWAVRRSSTPVRAYLDQHWGGTRSSGTKFNDLWTPAELIDREAAEAHARGGIAVVNWALSASDPLEHSLGRTGAEISLQVTRDWTWFNSLLSTRPPGESLIPPDWAVSAARNASGPEHQQTSWLRGHRPVDDDDAPAGGGARRRAKAEEKAEGGGEGTSAGGGTSAKGAAGATRS